MKTLNVFFLKGSHSSIWGENPNQIKQTKFCFIKKGHSPTFKSKSIQKQKLKF